MDREPQDTKSVGEGNDRFIKENGKALRENETKKKEQLEKYEIPRMVEVLIKTMEHFFPEMNGWLKRIRDPRNEDLITYELVTLLWVMILMFMTKREARRRVTYEFKSEAFLKNIIELTGQKDLETLPHGDTLNYVFQRGLSYEELYGVARKMVSRLIRKKVLERYRLFDEYYTVAIDGVHVYTYDEKHCDECMERKLENGEKKYYHYALEAKLVCWNGLVLPLATEWISEGKGKGWDKEDCELNAFYRLARKLKGYFPRLKICLLLDGLYAAKPVFDLSEELGWKYIATLKEGAMPEVYDWYERIRREYGKDNKIVLREEESKREYVWMSPLKHWDDERSFNIFGAKEKNRGETICNFTWITNFGVDKTNVEELSEKGGRLRWKIENEGNNMQKNGGYGLGHAYSESKNAQKGFHALMQIAHLGMQLIEKGSLLLGKAFGSIRNVAKRLFESLRYEVFQKPAGRPRIQIRFCEVSQPP